MNTVRLEQTPAQAWRNGGGRTRELLAWPDVHADAGAGADAWRVRVSVAEIAADGAFSAFGGVQRWFAVVQGAGVVLSLPQGDITVDADSQPLCFDGAAAPGCRLLAGATLDLNFMVRADAGRGTMRRAGLGAGIDGDDGIDGITAWRGLFTADAATAVIDGTPHAVRAGSLLWCDRPQPSPWRLSTAPARAWWLTLEAE